MRYTSLGRTGVQVSEFCLGTMTFGNESDEATSFAIMDAAFEAGINFFDTANVYNAGLTETIIGKWLPAHREEVVLATKAHFPTGDSPLKRGSSRRHVALEVDKSLRRLQTDWIDVLYLHHWDPHTPVDEAMAALDNVIRQGKVLYGAVSNYAAWQVTRALWCADRAGLAAPVALQPMYNLLKRTAEIEILPMAASEGIAVCPYNPLAAGVLTGKYLRGESGRISEHPVYGKRYGEVTEDETVRRFVAHAEERGISPAALAARWVQAHPAVTSTIIGARNLEQLNDTLTAVDIDLPADERAGVSALSPAPPLATDREA